MPILVYLWWLATVLSPRNWITTAVRGFILKFTIEFRAITLLSPAGYRRLQADSEKAFPDVQAGLMWYKQMVDELEGKIQESSRLSEKEQNC